MKISSFLYYASLVLSVLLIALSGCKEYSGNDSVALVIKEATAPFNDEKRMDTVPPISEKTVLVSTRYQAFPFLTETRKDKLERFKCSQCHNGKDVSIAKAADMAHGDISLVHGSKDKSLSCFTCHKKDALDFLVSEKGVKVDYDHSYQMCGQCHFRQKKDWVGGAHGKRVSYWAGTRVVKNCTFCHDPHSPRFAKRWPKTYSLPLDE